MFAGIGGICLAFKQVGATIVWANEFDHYACQTYRMNFGNDYLVENDIRKIDPTEIPDIDVLTAGFPCQPFSRMGKQLGFADPRGTMYFEILRVIDKKRPKVVLLENVKNLVRHDKGQTFKTIVHTLAKRRYGVKCAVLGPETHANVPQWRDRFFIAAFSEYKQWKAFEFPSSMPLHRTINDIIDRNIKAPEHYYYGTNSKYYSALNERVRSTSAIYRIDDSGVAMREWKVCPTLKANMGTYHDRVPIVRDAYGVRKLMPQECLAFQGFPVKFDFPDISEMEAYKQIGNTVCVLVVERIARKIINIQ
jgi:DNA (cytosine-5)-methyltransferase 1